MKKYILGLISGLLLAGIISVGASYIYKAADIEFNSSLENVEAANVQDALDDIFSSGNASENDIMSGKIALVNGKIITGNFKFGSLISTYNAWIKGSGTYTNGTRSLAKGKYIILFASSTNEYSASSTVSNCDNLTSIASFSFFNDAGTNGQADYAAGRGSLSVAGYICEVNSTKTITMQTNMTYNYKGRSSFAIYNLK